MISHLIGFQRNAIRDLFRPIFFQPFVIEACAIFERFGGFVFEIRGVAFLRRIEDGKHGIAFCLAVTVVVD